MPSAEGLTRFKFCTLGAYDRFFRWRKQTCRSPTLVLVGTPPCFVLSAPPSTFVISSDRNGFAATEMTSTIPNKPMGCRTTLHRPSATLARNETTAFSTPTAKSMEKISSNRQNAKDGRQEYPATTEASRLPAALPTRLSPCRHWTPRPLDAGWRPPALQPFAALRDSESR